MAITLIEFAIILFIKQNYGKCIVRPSLPCETLIVASAAEEIAANQPGKACINVSKESNSYQQTPYQSLAIDPTAAIDKITCIIFLISYLIFNLAYVLIYIHKN